MLLLFGTSRDVFCPTYRPTQWPLFLYSYVRIPVIRKKAELAGGGNSHEVRAQKIIYLGETLRTKSVLLVPLY